MVTGAHADAFTIHAGGGASGSSASASALLASYIGGGGGGVHNVPGTSRKLQRRDSLAAAVAGLTTPYHGSSSNSNGNGAQSGNRDRGRSRGASFGGGGALTREASQTFNNLPFQTPAKSRLPGDASGSANGGGNGDYDEEAGYGGGGGDGADGSSGGGGSSPAPGAHFVSGAAYARALDKISALTSRERELEGRVSQLTASLDAVHAGGGGGDLTSLLRSTTEELLELQEAHRALAARCDGLEDTIAKYESELRRAAGDVARFRLLLKEEKKRSEKLASAVEVGKEANGRAQAAIVELNARLAALTNSASGPITADSAAASAAAAAAASASSSSSSNPNSYQARLARTVSRQQSMSNAAQAAQAQMQAAAVGGGGSISSTSAPALSRQPSDVAAVANTGVS